MQRSLIRAFLWSVVLCLGTSLAAEARGDVMPQSLPLDVTVASRQDALEASDGMANDEFGAAVSISKDTALVGAPGQDDQGAASGAAYVFERVNGAWIEVKKLIPKLGGAGGRFGSSVAVSGAFHVIGANGSAYAFTREGDVFVEQELIPSNGDTFAGRSTRVAIMGDTAVVGTGLAAYVFVRETSAWVMQQKLVGAMDATLGDSVALFEHTLLASSMESSNSAGSVYVFVRNGGVWSQQAKLMPSKSMQNDGFGAALALGADLALIGAPQGATTADGDLHGVVHTFARTQNSWSMQKEFRTIQDDSGQDDFGYVLALSRHAVIVGTSRQGISVISRDGFSLGQPSWISGTVATSLAADDTTLLVGTATSMEAGFPGVVDTYTLAASFGSNCSVNADCASGYCSNGICALHDAPDPGCTCDVAASSSPAAPLACLFLAGLACLSMRRRIRGCS